MVFLFKLHSAFDFLLQHTLSLVHNERVEGLEIFPSACRTLWFAADSVHCSQVEDEGAFASAREDLVTQLALELLQTQKQLVFIYLYVFSVLFGHFQVFKFLL